MRTMTIITAILTLAVSSSCLAAIKPEYIDHGRIFGHQKICTNVVEYLDSRLQNIDSTASLTNVSFDVLLNDVTKTNNSTVSRIWTLEQTPSVPMWDLFLTYAESIPASAYRGAWNLRSVTSYSTANEISLGAYTFAYLPNLRRVMLGKVGTINNTAFRSCYLDELIISNSTSTSFQLSYWGQSRATRFICVPAKSTSEGALKWGSYQYVSLPNIVSMNNTFNSNTYIEEFDDAPNLTTIYNIAFYGCTSLKHVGRLPKLTAMPGAVFENCTSLTNVSDGVFDSMTTCAGGTFRNCYNLKIDINCPALQTQSSQSGFGVCGITSFTATNCTALGIDCFYNNYNMTNVFLPKLASINRAMCFGCTNLIEVDAHSVNSFSYFDSNFMNTFRLQRLYLGSALVDYNATSFRYMGRDSTATPNARGLKNWIYVNRGVDEVFNTMTRGQYNAIGGMKTAVACTNGFVWVTAYSWGQKQKAAYESVSDLPPINKPYYIYNVNGTNYRWNDDTRAYEEVTE